MTENGELVVESQKYRQQEQNKLDVIIKINKIVNQALQKKKKRIPTKPSKAAKKKRLAEKKERSEKKRARQKIKDY